MINFYFFTIGTCIASFLGLVVDRFPNQSILAPRSHCDHCQHVLGVWDLIPIISQLLHRFRCRYCHQPYPFWYCLFEVWSGLLFLLLAIGAHFFFIGMGAGDFLLLATFSLSFSSTKILILIQIASILGILVFALKKERDRIPFVPCLFLSYHALLLYTMFCR